MIMGAMQKIGALALAAALVFGTAACGDGSGSVDSANQIHIGRTEVFDGFTLDQELLNEDYAISTAVMEPLIRVGNEGKELQPGIAQSWQYNDNDTQLTIKLNPDAAFSNGKPVTADDVAFSLSVWKSGPNYGANYSSIASATVEDDHTIVFNLSQPDSSIPAFLSYAVAGVIPKDYGGKTAKEFYQHPVGAGAFAVESWSTDGDIVLNKNPHYYRKGYPKADRVINSYTPDSNSVALQLKAGQIDLVNQLDSITAKLLDSSYIAKVPAHQTPTLVLNTQNAFLANKSVRQAIAYAIDYESLQRYGFYGFGELPNSSLPPNLEGSPKTTGGYYRQDIDKAKQLLKGVDIPESITLTYPTSGISAAVVQIIQSDLKKVGINVELKSVDGGTWSSSLSAGTFDMSTFATNANSPDLIDAPSYVVSTKMLYAQMDTNTLAGLIDSYKESTDTAVKQQIVQQIDDYLSDEVPYVVLNANKVIVAKQPDIKGLEVQPWSCYYYDTLSH